MTTNIKRMEIWDKRHFALENRELFDMVNGKDQIWNTEAETVAPVSNMKQAQPKKKKRTLRKRLHNFMDCLRGLEIFGAILGASCMTAGLLIQAGNIRLAAILAVVGIAVYVGGAGK